MTSNHSLTRNELNEPVCQCGFRPEVLDSVLMTSARRQLHAKNIVLGHAEGLNAYESRLAALAVPVTNANLPAAPRSPADPFIVQDARYPRAGVRPTEDGKWLLTLWDGEQIQHFFPEPVFDDLGTAFDYGWLTIGACRQSGTSLNGMAAA